jgi:leucyl/phenylalanyl-tRNA--protein transferase
VSQIRLTADLLIKAYTAGVFPMAESRDTGDVFWVDPQRRGILPIDDVHVPRRLRRTVRRNVFEIRVDSAFEQVVRACAEPNDARPETWISEPIISAYTELQSLGFAHSVETWQAGKLVGGLYGVSIGGAFFGESMFTRARDASKVALVHLCARLMAGGFILLDTQFITEHLEQFGTIEIPRADYHRRLEVALAIPARFSEEMSDAEIDAYLQSLSQTS